jgi:hypothetical protein
MAEDLGEMARMAKSHRRGSLLGQAPAGEIAHQIMR